MTPSNLLIANRGEIAIRIMRAAAELEMRTTAVYSDDDLHSLHTRKADHAIALKGAGAKAYLDGDAHHCRGQGCRLRRDSSRLWIPERECRASRGRCGEAGITFVGPRRKPSSCSATRCGARARRIAAAFPSCRERRGPTSLEEARAFLQSLGPDGGDHGQSDRRRRRARHARRRATSMNWRRPMSAAGRRRRRRSAMATSMSSS